jgi:dihydropteroate synthase
VHAGLRIRRAYASGVSALRDRYRAVALMGVVNVTPDSFSDGGRFLDRDAAIAEGLRHAADGAAIVDVGGESTRPRSLGVSAAEEAGRVLPVIAGIRAASDVAISIDTSKAEVARAALAAGASFVNDVTALQGDPDLAGVVADAAADLCLMHMLGSPLTMQDDPRYDDVVEEVGAFLAARVEVAVAAGVARERICVDPGIGFGKTAAHNVALLQAIPTLEARAGAPVLIGLSRKSFLGRLLGDLDRDRAAATLAADLFAARSGAFMLRVHDVAPHRDALAIEAALEAPVHA